jgi:glycosyltransferase involved in cell wall biosynthesis
MNSGEAKSREEIKKNRPLVSVIIPCYNQGHYLGETIESVLGQTHQNFEIVVVDDGSTDNTSEVASGYAQVKLLHQQNQGRPAVGRNNGFRESAGEYIVFLDSDDRLTPDALEVGLKHLVDYPERAFVSGHARFIDAEGASLPTEQRACVERDHYEALLKENYIWTPGTVMFRRSALERAGSFNPSLRMKGSEDYDLYLRLARESPVYCHDCQVVEYRQHGSSLSRNSATMLKATLTVHRVQWPFVKGNKRYEEAYRKGRTFYQRYYGGRLVNEVRARVRQRRELKKVARDLLILLRYHPTEFLTQTYRKLYCVIFRVKSDPLEG